jgi:hypothetical protein
MDAPALADTGTMKLVTFVAVALLGVVASVVAVLVLVGSRHAQRPAGATHHPAAVPRAHQTDELAAGSLPPGWTHPDTGSYVSPRGKTLGPVLIVTDGMPAPHQFGVTDFQHMLPAMRARAAKEFGSRAGVDARIATMPGGRPAIVVKAVMPSGVTPVQFWYVSGTSRLYMIEQTQADTPPPALQHQVDDLLARISANIH